MRSVWFERIYDQRVLLDLHEAAGRIALDWSQPKYRRYALHVGEKISSEQELLSSTGHKITFLLCGCTLGAALIFGGGTRSGFLGDFLLQVIAIILLFAVAICIRADGGISRGSVLVWGAIFLVPVLQIVPLPDSVWMRLAGAPLRMQALEAIGRVPGWAPLSLLPEQTTLAFLSIIPPLAVFSATALMSARERQRLTVLVLIITMASIMLGVAQVAGGPSSPLYFFVVTNSLDSVGFFANRNHYSAFLYVSLLLCSAWGIDSGLRLFSRKSNETIDVATTITFASSISLSFVIAAGQVIARSRSGLFLTLLATIFIIILVLTDVRNKWRRTSVGVIFVLVVSSLIFAAHLGLPRLLDRFQGDAAVDARYKLGAKTLSIAKEYLPFGTGIGSFPHVYPLYETTSDLNASIYVNHAHNDLLELVMEGGILGLAALGAVLAWFSVRIVKAIRRRKNEDSNVTELLMQVALLSCILLMLHSLVDYPLHTSACMTLISFCAALSIKPRDLYRNTDLSPQDWFYQSKENTVTTDKITPTIDLIGDSVQKS